MAESKACADVSPVDAHTMLHERRCEVFLDVRTPEEFSKGHTEGAINIPLKVLRNGQMTDNRDFEKQVEAELGNRKDAFVVCTCFAGPRGATAAEKLTSAGFRTVANVAGGMGAWEKAELPFQGEIKPPGAI